MDNKPTFISRDGMIADSNYIQWIADIKSRFQQSQIKAAVKVNTSLLEFYWSLGRDIVSMQAESKWGSGFLNQLSLDLREAFPQTTGFSSRNIRYMKDWYLFYYERYIILHQVGAKTADTNLHQVGAEFEFRHQAGDEFEVANRQQAVDDLEMPDIFAIVPWRHHIQIFTKSKSVEEALFYINKVATEGWSRSRLESQMEKQLFLAQGAAVTNFEQTLPSSQIQIAKEILKDPYHFGFLNMKDEYAEKELEDALVSKITQFLLELGKGFAYVGRQMELRMDDETAFFPDLVFYHIPQKRYVIIELKAVKFEPEFAGKLNFYVTAADKLLKGDGDNESVGLIICKTAKKTIVEWSLKDINKPLGVSTYQLEEVVARTVAELEQQKEKSRK